MIASAYHRKDEAGDLLRILICDDQPPVLQAISEMIQQGAPNTETELFEDTKDLMKALEKDHDSVDGVFLDIVFSGEERTSVANRLHKLYPKLPIVFMTGHLQYAPDIFDAAPAYLLAKPFQPEKVAQALRVIEQKSSKETCSAVTIRVRGGLRTLRTRDIEYFESKGRKVTVHGAFEPAEFYGKLTELQDTLPENFVCCHQSFLVNMDEIALVGSDDITMSSGTVLPIAKRRRNMFREAFVMRRAPAEDEEDNGRGDDEESAKKISRRAAERDN